MSGFLDKNRDTVQSELLDLLFNSKNPFVSGIFAADRSERDKLKDDDVKGELPPSK